MTWQIAISQPSQLGESPFWHPDEQRLYWVDIPACQVCRAKPLTGNVERWTLPSEPGCIAPAQTRGQSTGLVIALRDGIYRVRHWGGELELLASALHDAATTRFNDGKADSQGRFWAGTIYEPRDAARAQLFCLDVRGSCAPALQVKASGATTANGLAWSPDGTTLYWADTPRHMIRTWDWDAASNVMRSGRIFRQWPAKPAGWRAGMPEMPEMPDMPNVPAYGGRPDGAAVDVEGNYYVAMYEGARLLKLSPSGETLADFAVPAQCPTMPCFGGADLKTLYLTTARQGRPADELRRWPNSGCVLFMPVDVPGLPVNFFVD